MRKILLLLAFCVAGGAMMAQEEPVQKLIVWKMDGTQLQFLLTDDPVTTFENGNLVISTNQGVFSYPLAQTKKYTHEGILEGIENTVAPGNILVRQNNEMMLIEGLPDNQLVEVYSANGKLILSKRAIGGQGTLLSLIGQPQGAYVVSIGKNSFKFVKP